MIEEYIKHLARKGYRRKTYEKRRRELGYFYDIEGKGIDRAPQKIVKYFEYLRSRSYKQSTIRFKLQLVMAYFRYLYKEGRILHDPTPDIKLPPKSLPRRIPSYKTIENIIDRIDTTLPMGERDRAILELFYSSGIRRKELVNLDIYDVDLKKGHVFIREGKGRKDRVVPIGKEASRWIERYINKRRKRQRKSPKEKALFLAWSGRRLGYSAIDKIFKSHASDATGKVAISAHRLRHACALGMVRNGANIRYVQELLGHAKLSSTEIYTKLSPEDLKKIHSKYHPR